MALMFSPAKFISEVRNRPVLYSTEQIHDRADKFQLWKEVGAALFSDWETCNKATMYDRVLQLQKKWRSLRDAYNRELRMRKQHSGRKRRVYKYFKKMSFLGGFEGSVSPDLVSDTEDTEAYLYPQDIEDDTLLHSEPQGIVQIINTQKKKKRKRQTDSPKTEEVEMPLFPVEMTMTDTESDNDRLFLLSFLPEMKQLPINIKMWARAQIAQVMQEAVNSQFNNSKPCSSLDMVDVKNIRESSE